MARNAYPPGTDPAFTLAGGPSGNTRATLAALSRPVLHHQDPEFGALYERTTGLLRQAFGTGTDPVILQGEAVVGLEAAAASLIGPGDVVLNLVSGIFGRGFGALARRYAREVVQIEVGYDSAVPAALVERALAARPEISLVSVVHCETPSGTVNDLDAIAAAVAGHGALLLIDAVSSFGGMWCDFAGWRADLAVVAPQKCLGGPPGLSLLHVSAAAWDRMEANPAAPRGSALSILDWRDAHLPDRPFPFTPSVTEIYGLHACLEQYLAEGAGNVWRRHRLAADAVRAGVVALGLSLWAADPAIRSDTVTAIVAPDGVDERELRARARTDSGVMLSGGQGDFAGRVFQIGHMGPAAFPLAPVIALTAIGRAVRALGGAADIGAGVSAAVEILDGRSGSAR